MEEEMSRPESWEGMRKFLLQELAGRLQRSLRYKVSLSAENYDGLATYFSH